MYKMIIILKSSQTFKNSETFYFKQFYKRNKLFFKQIPIILKESKYKNLQTM
jgi:hypothetical protein